MGMFSGVTSAVKKVTSSPLGLMAANPLLGQAKIGAGIASNLLKAPEVPGAKIPGMSPEEQAILKQQQELLQRFTPIFGKFAEDIISGKVPVDQALEQDLMQREAMIREDIARRGGSSSSALSTAGIQRLGQFQTGADIARGEARRSLIPQAFQAIGTLGNLASSALSPLQQQRQFQTNIALQQQQQAAAAKAQRQGILGNILGGAVSGGVAGSMMGGVGAIPGALLGAAGGTSLLPMLANNQGGGAGTISTPQPSGSRYFLDYSR